MNSIRIKKGYDLKIAGAPDEDTKQLPAPDRVALLPSNIPFIKPKLTVKTGDAVQVGSPLVEDKREPSVKLLSPGGGRIADIQFGPRRVLEAIVVEIDEDEKHIEFSTFSENDIEKMQRRQLVQAIVDGGLWPLIRELPFRDYPLPDASAPAIYVALDSLEPFHPRLETYLQDKRELLDYGLKVMQRLADGRLVVSAHVHSSGLIRQLNGAVTLTYAGGYPAHDPGVLLYHTKSSADQNHAWFIDAHDVVLIAELLRDGRYPTHRIISVAGSAVKDPGHAAVRIGMPLADLTADRIRGDDLRIIGGGILTGYASAPNSYLGLREKSINLLPQGNRPGELLSLFRPGYHRPSFSRAFTSRLNNAALEYDCNIHGGDRACIACGYCTLICPVDILPQFTYKSILAGEVEESLQHGLLDCVECGLCSYVCPSKLDLAESFKQAKADFYKELGK